MNKTHDKPQFYFSLLRLIAMLRGGNAGRSEGNGPEAWLVGLSIYAIHYLFFATLCISSDLGPWVTALLLVVLGFWVWLFWLLFLYFSSIIIKLLRMGGIFCSIPTRRAQSILWGTLTTLMACLLLEHSPALRELGTTWLVAVAMNLVSAAILAFRDATRSSTK